MTDEFHRIASDFPDPFRLLLRENTGSTNDDLLALGRVGSPAGLVLVALEQSAGRGRRGNTWFSSGGGSLAFSILVRPAEPKALWPRLALAAGLAVSEAIERFGVSSGIKWPNDVWVGGRKISGILVEADEGFAVIGIGLNVNTAHFPDEVAPIATSLNIETGVYVPLPEVLGAIVRCFSCRVNQIGADFSDLLDAVRQRCVLTGHHVSLHTANGQSQGIVEGIAPDGALLLQTARGLESIIQADEVRINA